VLGRVERVGDLHAGLLTTRQSLSKTLSALDGEADVRSGGAARKSRR
jgi:hypothetical protein